MHPITLVAIAFALAMDAFAVAVVAGLTLDTLTKRRVFRLSFHFGLFQAMMPAVGWCAGIAVHGYIAEWDHWIALALLAYVGGTMLIGAISGDESRRRPSDPTRGWDLVLLSVATSIDALAVGLTLAMLGESILVPAAVIGIVAAATTVVGMLLGKRIGAAWGSRVELVGGLILLAIGAKIVIEHTM